VIDVGKLIRPATCIAPSSLLAAMNAAFSDYPIPMQLTNGSFDLMLRMRGYMAEHSRVCCVNGKVVAFWLVGVREARAYLISSGTLPAYRRKCLSKLLGQAVIAHLRDCQVKSLQSEVLENNPSARALYRALGFSEIRGLDSYTLNPISGSNVDPGSIGIEPLPFEPEVRALWDVCPSWQNDLASLAAAGGDAACLAIRDGNRLVAYAAFTPGNGTLAQLAVRPDQRRRGLATALLTQGQRVFGLQSLRVINLDRTAKGASAFFKALDAQTLVSQKELLLQL